MVISYDQLVWGTATKEKLSNIDKNIKSGFWLLFYHYGELLLVHGCFFDQWPCYYCCCYYCYCRYYSTTAATTTTTTTTTTATTTTTTTGTTTRATAAAQPDIRTTKSSIEACHGNRIGGILMLLLLLLLLLLVVLLLLLLSLSLLLSLYAQFSLVFLPF